MLRRADKVFTTKNVVSLLKNRDFPLKNNDYAGIEVSFALHINVMNSLLEMTDRVLQYTMGIDGFDTKNDRFCTKDGGVYRWYTIHILMRMGLWRASRWSGQGSS